ncbi:MAG: molecular chaperone [Bacteroidales bacterium]|nr:molecular chaperone [Bacteroidales bacterium]
MQRIIRNQFIVISALLFSAILLNTGTVQAQGDLLVTPRRVIFEGSKMSQELTLANTGSDTSRYSVSFVQYRMTENGAFEQIEVPDSGQYFADKYLRFFPRTVTLAPNEAQVVRMQFRKMPDMKPGEYRSHVYFRAVPDEKPLGEEAVKDTTTIGIRLVPIFGITIPIIIRVGELKSSIEVTDMKLDAKTDTIPSLALTFKRKGDISVYGDLIVSWDSGNGQPVEVGVVRGIAVYTPNKTRRFVMQLRNLKGVDYNRGKLIDRFQAPNEQKAEIYAEKEFPIQ